MEDAVNGTLVFLADTVPLKSLRLVVALSYLEDDDETAGVDSVKSKLGSFFFRA